MSSRGLSMEPTNSNTRNAFAAEKAADHTARAKRRAICLLSSDAHGRTIFAASPYALCPTARLCPASSPPPAYSRSNVNLGDSGPQPWAPGNVSGYFSTVWFFFEELRETTRDKQLCYWEILPCTFVWGMLHRNNNNSSIRI